MKVYVFFLLTLATLFYSCNKGEIIEDKAVCNLSLRIVICDETQNDRLSPESSAYFGDYYMKGIELLFLCDGKKCTFIDYYRFIGGGSWFWIDDVENHVYVSPPFRQIGEYNIDQLTLGYYYIDCTSSAYIMEYGQKVTYTYIKYPDGNEDEIKTQIYEAPGLMINEKIWINGELAYEMGAWGAKDFYYNPKYYPWMKPVYDDIGSQKGVMPEAGNMVVMIK